jgi:hypothetical protein
MDTASLVCFATEEAKIKAYNTALWDYNQTARYPEQHEYFKMQVEEIKNKPVKYSELPKQKDTDTPL